MENVETPTLQVNKIARRLRHMKSFSKLDLVKSYMLVPVKALAKTAVFKGLSTTAKSLGSFTSHLLPVAPQKRLMSYAALLSATALIGSAVIPSGFNTVDSLTHTNQFVASASSVEGGILVTDDMGYLVKINPQTNDSSRIGMTDFAVHTVESGESLSVIAEHYGVTSKTIMWENNLANPNNLKIGQKLMVPPVDGVSYKVSQGDTLDKLAEKYDIEVDSIIAQNALSGDLVVGETVFLPGAEPLNPVVVVQAGGRNVSTYTDTRTYSAASSTSAPAIGKIFIFPTIGSITQGYVGGHHALDIANRSMPPIWAAGGGTVTKSSVGTWGGGYGNHVIIDHGNGIKTLYAHMNTVNVSVGDWVNQGDVIGQMGNTGRVYGATGIHLHWEVIVNGVKQYPANYY